MTRYAVTDDGTLLRSWPTPLGDHAELLTSAGADPLALQRVADLSTRLSAALWRVYAHPDDVDDEWRRERTPEGFADVIRTVADERLYPGGRRQSDAYEPIAQYASLLGEALAGIGDPTLTRAVADEVTAEVTAVLRADVGDLGGRAAQAVTLSRAEASPAQVAEAHIEFDTHPFGSDDLYTAFEPSAAAVAAAHWLRAAARVAADLAGVTRLSSVVLEADDIAALPVETPVEVLNRLQDGESPEVVCAELINDALQVAAGETPAPGALAVRLNAFIDGPLAEAGEPFRLCRLDPARPATDLLEHLVTAIFGCWLVYREHRDVGVDLDEDDDDVEAGDVAEDDDAEQGGKADAMSAAERALLQRFEDSVRVAATI